MADQNQFYALLSSLLSYENDRRSEAEKVYNNLTVEVKVTNLLTALHDANIDLGKQEIAAVLLRRLFSSDFQEFYSKLPPESQAQLKEQLLLAIQQDRYPSVRQKICELIAEVARLLLDDDGNNQWPELLEFLFRCVNSQNVGLQESALRIFAAVPNIFGNQENQYLAMIKNMFQQSIQPNVPEEVRVQSVRAVGAFILAHEKDSSILKVFSDMLPQIVEVIRASIEKEDDQILLKLLVELAESCPKFLRGCIEIIFEMCIKTFSNREAEDNWRHLGLEVMVSLAENAPAMVRNKAGRYVATLIPIILQMMADIEDDEDWAVNDEDDDSNDDNIIAESALDRLACGLGGKSVLPHVANTIPAMVQSDNWKQRYAALMAVSAIGEGCHKQMESMLDDVMNVIIQFFNDPHPRVRYACCNAIGQMSTDFAPIFEKKFHEQVIPGLLHLLDDVENPRVQAHAGAALVNFSEDCPKNILTKYLDSIMQKLGNILSTKFNELLQTGTKMVLEQIVTTIASVADTSEKEFAVYYDNLMPCLKYIITNATSDDLRMLRGKTIECVSLIGLAVGQDKFMADANAIMTLLLETQTVGELPDDDPQTSYLISAWARMCKILGKQFEQYLPLVMGPVMRTAAMKPEVAFLDNDEVEDIEGDVDWSFINLGEQQNFAIRTAGMEEKASACDMLVCYARELKEGFADFAEEVVKLMVPMLKFYFHDGVRTAAAESLPYLLDCAKIKGPTYLEGMWQYICPELLKAIDTEPEGDVLFELLHSLAKSIETLGANCLSAENMTEVLRLISKYMDDHFRKAEKRELERNEEDYDDGVEEKLAQEDDNDTFQLSKIADVIHSLFLTNGVSFLPHFDQIIQHFIKLLNPQRPWADRQWGLCIFDDLIEYTGPMCAKYQSVFLQPIIEYVKDPSPEVQQAAIYGCGVIAQFGGDQFALTCAQTIPRLVEVVQAPKSREPENVNPTENAISAITKILKYNNSAIPNVDELIMLWFSWLPVVEDHDESPHVYGYLCDLIQSNHIVVLGASNSNLPRILQIIAEAFNTDVIEPQHEVGVRMLQIVKQLENNQELFKACFDVLNVEQKKALQDACLSLMSAPVP
ncbi:Importin-5 [Pseudolycoriella hygida]|uniref:Importin-5 n=1 Tax=Pseudolycoriella hygida TaxID=35572 RepID=A0A9Q0MKH7_9DIPT|nr:Importin-5 [Pseudolycoriella hygida]